MFRILIDADVLIDVALDQRPHSEASAELLNRAKLGHCQAFVAWHTVSNFYYVVKSRRGDLVKSGGADAETRAFIEEILQFTTIAPTVTADIHYALSLDMSDFEDAMQVAAAKACQASYVVTRNLVDFTRSPVPALKPTQAIEALL